MSNPDYPDVPDTGSDDARVRWGAREINKTRDWLSAVKALIPSGKSAYQAAAGISKGTANPSGGASGDLYFKIVG